MTFVLEAQSRLTDRYQTTVPASVRKALSLKKRDTLRFVVQADGQVVLTRVVERDSDDDPVLGRFLDFLAADMAKHPERLQALDAKLAERMDDLLGDMDVDLDATLADE
jgi:antitoxin PrlF